MTRKRLTKAKDRKKYSALCEKRTQLKNACVFIPEHNVWAICKGKSYVDGRFRYIYNGREGISQTYQTIVERDGLTKKALKDEAIKLNLQQLQMQIPAKPRNRRRNNIFQYIEPQTAEFVLPMDLVIAAPPVVEQEAVN